MHQYRHVSEEGKIECGYNKKQGEHFFKLNIKPFTGEMSSD